ncbi:MAG: PASTA domain-containing protein, partial [Ilumatobacter sp.]
VSAGAAPVLVPVVEGLTQGNATNQLRDRGFNVDTQFQEVSPGSSDDGRVISQTPAAATELEPGSTVTIVVGQAREAVTTTTTTTTTTVPPTTIPPTTVPPTTAAPTTAAPTTAAPTTAAPTTADT